MSDLLIPETWEHTDTGTWCRYRLVRKTWIDSGSMHRTSASDEKYYLGHFLPGDAPQVSRRHVGWIGTDLVAREPDGSEEVRVALADWEHLDNLNARLGVTLSERWLRELLAANPEVVDAEARESALEEARRAANEREEAERLAEREAAEQRRPRYEWDGDDLVVKVVGREVARAPAAHWNVPPPGDRVNRLGRILKVAGYDLSRETRIAMVNAHESTPPDAVAEALRAVRVARAELEAGLARLRDGM